MRASKIFISVLLLIPMLFATAVFSHHNMVDTSEYNYKHFAASQYTHGFFAGPGVGEDAVDFTLTDAKGNEHSLSDFQGQYVVIETGSLTCPQYISRIEPMSQVVNKYPDVSFLTLYVREAHPGSIIPEHSTLEDKRFLANRLLSEENETRIVLVDQVFGTVHQSYGGWPNMVYVISPEGHVAFRGMWNNPAVVSEVLTRLKAGESVEHIETGITANFGDAARVLERAGGYAKLDFVLGVVASAVGYARKGVD